MRCHRACPVVSDAIDAGVPYIWCDGTTSLNSGPQTEEKSIANADTSGVSTPFARPAVTFAPVVASDRVRRQYGWDVCNIDKSSSDGAVISFKLFQRSSICVLTFDCTKFVLDGIT